MNETAKPGPDRDKRPGGGRRIRAEVRRRGLATCVTIDAARGDVLMVAHMNEAALRATLATGIVHYWSRSRGALWRKGDTSGQTQTLVEMRVDCDQDAFLAFVTVAGDGAPAIPAGDRASTDGRDGRRHGSARVHRTFDHERLIDRPRRGQLHITLIVWRYPAGKLKFLTGRRAVRSFPDELGDVQGGLSQNRF